MFATHTTHLFFLASVLFHWNSRITSTHLFLLVTEFGLCTKEFLRVVSYSLPPNHVDVSLWSWISFYLCFYLNSISDADQMFRSTLKSFSLTLNCIFSTILFTTLNNSYPIKTVSFPFFLLFFRILTLRIC